MNRCMSWLCQPCFFNSLSMEITTTQNELFRIGALVYDLNLRIEIGPEASGFEFLHQEFRRITLSLGYQWYEKMPGFGYLIEFHKAEVLRLMEIVVKLENFQVELTTVGEQDGFLQDLHCELILHFTDLLKNLDKMMATPDVPSRPFNLN